MIYIFFDTKWKLFDGELPVKPNVNPVQYVDPNYHPEIYDRKHPYLKMEEYNQAIADIKSKALEIDNPEMVPMYSDGVGNYYLLPSKQRIVEGEFYQWPSKYRIGNNKAILEL